MKILNIAISTLVMISILSLTAVASFAEIKLPITAAQRVQNLANEETTWRYIGGGSKLVVGGLFSALGYTLVSYRENFFGAMVAIPMGIGILIPGVAIAGWGAVDLLFGSREYEDQYKRLETTPEPQREQTAADYLKAKSEKDHKDRQPSFWNGFGLFSMFETPAEREYKAYLKGGSGGN